MPLNNISFGKCHRLTRIRDSAVEFSRFPKATNDSRMPSHLFACQLLEKN